LDHVATLQLATQRAQNRPAPIAEARAALDAHDFERARILAFTATILRPREPAVLPRRCPRFVA